MTSDPIPTTRLPVRRCWLCASTTGRMRGDIYCAGLPLCARCWDAAPRGYNLWQRSASALAVLLDLPRTWDNPPYRSGWLQAVAARHRVTAWHDVDTRTTPAPDEPFGWLDPAAAEAAAAELADREQQFAAARVGAGARRP